MVDTSFLNENQARGVNWGRGPVLVLAGPGSGKTFVLTMRVARLIEQAPDARFRVLGLTFTTKAADEMRQRVAQLLGPDARRARLTTFHSFCADVLRQHGSHVGLRPDYEIVTQETDRVAFLNEAIRAAAVAEMPRVDGAGVVKLLDHLLREGFDGDESTPLPFAKPGKEWIRPIFREYTERLIRSNQLDFGTLLHCSLRLFRERPRVAKHYRVVYPYVCVDEYQDTNKVQDLILRSLCPGRDANLFVVADDDQIIYQWNGASPERLRSLRRDYDMSVIQLPESYRCSDQVIELANSLIRFNTERSPDKRALVAAGPAPVNESVRVRRFPDFSNEVSWVAADIAESASDPSSCAVLGRSAKLVRRAASALRQVGLSPYVAERKSEFESPLLRFVHATLRLANAPQDHEQLRHLCRAFYDLVGDQIRPEDAQAESALHAGSLLRGFLGVAGATADYAWADVLSTLSDDLVERLNYRAFTKAVFSWCDVLQDDDEGRDVVEQDEIKVWKDIQRNVRQSFGDDPTLSQFLQELDLRQKTSPPHPGDVQCLTIHMAKGKEFDHVYLIGLAEDHLPSYFAKQKGDSSREVEEERRSCFVAITRARSQLTLTFASSYFGWRKRPSRFLAEMGIDSESVGVTRPA